MSVPPHQFPSGFTNSQQNNMRSQFAAGLQSQITAQLANQMPVQMGGQMVPQMNQLTQAMNTQMMNQLNSQYGMSATLQQQAQSQLQMQQQSMQMQQSASQMQQSQQMQQQPQQQQQTVQNAAPTPPAPQPVSSINTVSLCRIGQETVQDIVSRTQEVFQNLKAIQPPNGTVQGLNSSNEKKAKVQEQLRTIRVLFKRLRLIYEKCNENSQLQGMEYTHIESLIPFKDEPDPKSDEKKTSEAYRLICDESKEIMEQVVLKNRQLKEVIDHLRRIIWEINTMLAMRRS